MVLPKPISVGTNPSLLQQFLSLGRLISSTAAYRRSSLTSAICSPQQVSQHARLQEDMAEARRTDALHLLRRRSRPRSRCKRLVALRVRRGQRLGLQYHLEVASSYGMEGDGTSGIYQGVQAHQEWRTRL